MVHDLPFASVVQQQYVLMKSELKTIDHDGGLNPQSSDSKSEALSIRQNVQKLSCHCKYTIYVPNVYEIQSKQYQPWIPMVHDLPFASVVQQQYVLMKSDFNIIVHDGIKPTIFRFKVGRLIHCATRS